MKKTICDECGKETTPGGRLKLGLGKEGNVNSSEGETTIYGQFSVSRTTIYYNGGGPGNVDLCIDCLIKYLKKYMKQAEDYREFAKSNIEGLKTTLVNYR